MITLAQRISYLNHSAEIFQTEAFILNVFKCRCKAALPYNLLHAEFRRASPFSSRTDLFRLVLNLLKGSGLIFFKDSNNNVVEDLEEAVFIELSNLYYQIEQS
jgi:hypothetical protein